MTAVFYVHSLAGEDPFCCLVGLGFQDNSGIGKGQGRTINPFLCSGKNIMAAEYCIKQSKRSSFIHA